MDVSIANLVFYWGIRTENKPYSLFSKPYGYHDALAIFHTTAMATPQEKAAFAERLKQALVRSQKRLLTPNELATQFNLRHPNEPITPQAALKWLKGQAKPRGDKMATLAEWLDVPDHWLNYGSPVTKQKNTTITDPISIAQLTSEESIFVSQYRRLTNQQQLLIRDLVTAILIEKELHS